MSAAFNSLVCVPTPEGGLICRPPTTSNRKPKSKKSTKKPKSKAGPSKAGSKKAISNKKHKPAGNLQGTEAKQAQRAIAKQPKKNSAASKKPKKPENGYNF